MMDIVLHEVVNFSLVILNVDLLPTDDAVRRFQSAADVEIRQGLGVSVTIGQLGGQPSPVKSFQLDRDRITMSLSEERSSITKEFPAVNSLESEIRRFADVVSHAASSSPRKASDVFDFGYNAEMVFNQNANPTAYEFLGEHLINYEKITALDHQFVGGSCQMITRDDQQRQWTYNLAPRFNDVEASRVFIGINVHSTQRPLPQGAEIVAGVQQIVSNATELLNRLSE